jgi:hypothetical protein
MKILKVNELNAETYLSAARKLRYITRGLGNQKRSFELTKYAEKIRKLEGEYWIRRPGSKEKDVIECWIIPSVRFSDVKKDLKFNRNEESHICNFVIIFETFEFDTLDFVNCKHGNITLGFNYYIKLDEDGKILPVIYQGSQDRGFIFSNRREVVKFKKAMKDWNWTKNIHYADTPEIEIEESEDTIWEYQILKTAENEFNKLPINFFYSE